MNAKIANAKHVDTDASTPLHRTLKTRATAALTAGCLALTMCPAIALAAPPAMPDQGGSQPAMQQGAPSDQQDGQDMGGNPGQMPSGPQGQQAPGQFGQPGQGDQQEMPSGGAQAPQGAPDQGQGGQQAPQGAPGQAGPMGNDGVDDQIRQILSDSYGIDTAQNAPNGQPGQASDESGTPGQGGFTPGDPADAPELPEGAVNVQKLIDSLRDAFRLYGSSALEAADFTDADFTSTFDADIQNATSEREAQFASGEKPSDLPSGQPSGAASEAADGTAPSAPEAPSAITASTSVISNLVDHLMSLFGYNAA